ncbi:MAG TPA: collagen-like protein [Solirubrobacterales bacterium]|nr:collagen-like protein [Solirubrobacterales bacterium]
MKAALGFVLMLGALVVVVLASSVPAGAASIVARDGKVHACYKAKGKGRGTLRVVRSAKARCPKRWKKVAWNAGGAPGPRGETGALGSTGATGERGERGEKGTAGNVSVEELESKVTELLSRVQSLEAILNGVTNQQLQEAIGQVPVVESLCEQSQKLTESSGELRSALGSFNTVLESLIPLFSPVPLPTSLSPYACPA